MRSKLVLTLILCLVSPQAYAVQDGVEAKDNPNVGALFIEGRQLPWCTGVYIKERIVATASYCLENYNISYVSYAGGNWSK